MNRSHGTLPASPSTANARRRRIRTALGLTLIELLVSIAVLAVLLAVGVPSFAAMARQWQQDAAIDTFVGDVRLARSTAVRTSRPVVMCALDHKTGACTPHANWTVGWMVFSDLDADGAFDAGEPVIAHRGAQAGNASLIEASPSPSQARLQFRSNGTLSGGGVKLNLTPEGTTHPVRLVVLNFMGRSRVANVE